MIKTNVEIPWISKRFIANRVNNRLLRTTTHVSAIAAKRRDFHPQMNRIQKTDISVIRYKSTDVRRAQLLCETGITSKRTALIRKTIAGEERIKHNRKMTESKERNSVQLNAEYATNRPTLMDCSK
jgi:hypothetical protein